MKVGHHKNETLEQILARKNLEHNSNGTILWGYGGVTAHPKTIQGFARSWAARGVTAQLLMIETSSKSDPNIEPADRYSTDEGLHWQNIPPGVNVTGSKYALLLGTIRRLNPPMQLNLGQYEVGWGPNKGRKTAAEYLRGRVDKGCFELAQEEAVDQHPQPITYRADLVPPYAVWLPAGATKSRNPSQLSYDKPRT